MGRHKAAQNCNILPWVSGKADCKEGRFIQIGNSLLLSKEYQALSPGAGRLYLCMAMESGGHRRFEFPEETIKKYGIAPRSARRYIEELIEHRFIICISSGKNTRTNNEYEFFLDWKPRFS